MPKEICKINSDMKITQVEIKFIDDYLRKGGIKYWDIRLEMVDHLVSDMEHYLGSADFNTLFKRSLRKANWNTSLNEINKQSWKTTNKIYRAKHYNEILTLLKNPLYLISIVCFYISFNWLTTKYPETLKSISFIIVFIPILILIYEVIKSVILKLGRSVNLDYGFFYFSFGLLMINLPLQLLPKAQLPYWLPFLLSVYLLVMFAGYRVYKFAFRKIMKMKNVN